MNVNFVRFPNGNVWDVSESGQISGTVRVQGADGFNDLESYLDAISEAATGSIAGLADFSYRALGGDIVAFSGTAESYLDWDPDDEDTDQEFELIEPDDPRLAEALAAQYGLTSVEAQHLLANLETTYDDECELEIVGSHRKICSPAHPGECSYVRVTVGGFEIAYWTSEEWEADPDVVMGAFLGAAKGG